MAWRARDALGLDPALQALLQDRLRRVADGPYWRYPTLRLNQINWYAEVYNAASEATGDPIWLQRDLRGQLVSLVNSIRQPALNTAGSLGPGMQFHYLPHGSVRSKLNIESAEYANIVASVVRFYDAAVLRGMQPLPAADELLLRRWMRRVLAGYWTHAGYLNWDTGFSFGRWHQMKKFALSQQALIGIAAGGRLSPSRGGGVVGQAPPRARLRALRAQAARRRRQRGAGPLLSAQAQAAVQQAGDLRRRRGWSPTPAARSRPASPRVPAPSRPRSTRSTRRRGAWRSPPPGTTRRSRRSPTARTRTAGSTSRGSTTAARRWRRRSARGSPPPSASWPATATARSASPRRGRRATGRASRRSGSCARR